MIVANSAYFAARYPASTGCQDVADGLLDVITVSEGSKLSFVRVMFLSAARGKHTPAAQVGATLVGHGCHGARGPGHACRGRWRAAAVRVTAGHGHPP